MTHWQNLVLWTAGLLAWSVFVLTGFGLMWKYELTPGAAGNGPEVWPCESCLAPPNGRPCLVLALHPRCPCSRATLSELAEIRTRCGDRVEVVVLFYSPASSDAEWAHTDLWDQAAALKGVQIQHDPGGVEQQRFGALTSGQAALYSAEGRLLFRGGITRARGHAGDNDGREAVIAHVLGTAGRARTDVFGCPLCEMPSATEATGDSPCTTRE